MGCKMSTGQTGVRWRELQGIDPEFSGFPARWGRHGFDGIACGKEACRGVGTRNRSQNDNCRSSTGIRSLIN